MIVVIDNRDSFVFNLARHFQLLGVETAVVSSHEAAAEAILAAQPAAIVISPGPCTPAEAGCSLDLVRLAIGHVPLFGVCLGLQSIGQSFGGKVVRAPAPMHGKVSRITHTGHAMFAGIPRAFSATRYHSLIVERATLPACLEVTAESDDGLIMALAHKTLPITSVQFHPESIASEWGHRILRNFLVSTGFDAKPEPAFKVGVVKAAS